MTRLSMDLKVMPRSYKGKNHFCSHWWNSLLHRKIPIHPLRSEKTGNALIEHVFNNYCIHECIIIDHDCTPMSILIGFLFKKLCIKIKTVASYNHQSLQAEDSCSLLWSILQTEHGTTSLANIFAKACKMIRTILAKLPIVCNIQF